MYKATLKTAATFLGWNGQVAVKTDICHPDGISEVVRDMLFANMPGEDIPAEAVLVKWNGRLFLCEADGELPDAGYTRVEVADHIYAKHLA